MTNPQAELQCEKCAETLRCSRERQKLAQWTEGEIEHTISYEHVECFTYTWDDYNVTRTYVIPQAQEILRRAPREPYWIGLENLKGVISQYDGGVNEAHLDHIPTPYAPGIAVLVQFPDDEQPSTLLIDGYHRAAACLREGKKFQVYILNLTEESQCRLEQWTC